jgi:hypothetical protein
MNPNELVTELEDSHGEHMTLKTVINLCRQTSDFRYEEVGDKAEVIKAVIGETESGDISIYLWKLSYSPNHIEGYEISLMKGLMQYLYFTQKDHFGVKIIYDYYKSKLQKPSFI